MNIHLKTAVSHIKRSPFQALAAIFVLTLTFFVGTILAVLVYSTSGVLSYFETRPQIIAFLKNEATPETVSALQSRLASDMRVKDVRYVSKDEALSIYKKATSDNPLLSELVSPAIFPASLEISLRDLQFAEALIAELKSEGVVDQVGFTASLGGESTLKGVVERLKTITNYLRLGGGFFVGLLILSSFFMLLVIIGMRISSRKDEIAILDLIGAKPGFIRSPIMLEALIYAEAGVFLGWVFALILVLYTAPNVISYFGEIAILPRSTLGLLAFFGIVLVVQMVVGATLALLGSMLAISRAASARQG